MNSMFSAFDAMSAEIMGKKVTAASYVCNPSEAASSGGGGGQTVSLLKKDENATSLAKKQPRYALELDGIYCFETIVRSWFQPRLHIFFFCSIPSCKYTFRKKKRFKFLIRIILLWLVHLFCSLCLLRFLILEYVYKVNKSFFFSKRESMNPSLSS